MNIVPLKLPTELDFVALAEVIERCNQERLVGRPVSVRKAGVNAQGHVYADVSSDSPAKLALCLEAYSAFKEQTLQLEKVLHLTARAPGAHAEGYQRSAGFQARYRAA